MSRARRAAVTAKRQEWAHELDVRWAFKADRLPLYAEAVSVCSCGRQSWLMPGASHVELEAFERDNADHDYMHELES